MRVCSICLSLFLWVRTIAIFTTFHSLISFTLAPGSVKHENSQKKDDVRRRGTTFPIFRWRILPNLSLFFTKLMYCFLSTLFNQKGLQLRQPQRLKLSEVSETFRTILKTFRNNWKPWNIQKLLILTIKELNSRQDYTILSCQISHFHIVFPLSTFLIFARTRKMKNKI